MTEILQNILKDHKSDIVFSCFNIWHILYMAIILGVIVTLVLCFRNKSEKVKTRIINITILIALLLYALDFFLMPFAYGAIDIEKLPFHICTVSCILCFLSRHNKFFAKFKKELLLFGLIGNFIYLVYPLGVQSYKVHPLSYRVVQTLLYHGVMVGYGIFCLSFNDVKLSFKTCWKEVVVNSILVVWALFGNFCYNGLRSPIYNWMFVVEDPLGIIPNSIGKFIMPFVILIVLFICDMIVHGLYYLFKTIFRRKIN